METLKEYAIGILLVQTVVSGMIPILFRKRLLLSSQVISIGNCLTAGIFLSMGLSHILFEARESEEEIGHSSILSGKLHLHVFIGTFILVFGIEAIISGDERLENGPVSANPDSNQVNESPRELFEISANSPDRLALDEPLAREAPELEAKPNTKEHAFLNFVFITGAMSIHSVSSGLALGVQEDYNSVMSILVGRID